MSTELMLHQREGIEFLLSREGALLAFEQGLGKTLVAIEAFRRAKSEKKADALVVICPNSLKRNWEMELKKFAPELSVEIVEGAARQRRKHFSVVSSDVIVTSYETARSEVTSILALLRRRTSALTLDESHAVKTWRSLTSTAARNLAPYAKFRWLLSGTPVTNSPADLYAQVEILEPKKHVLGSLESFVATAKDSPEAIRGKIDQLVMRRTKEQCLDLPEKTFIDIRVDLPRWQRNLYDDMRDKMISSIQEMSGPEYKAFASTALVRLTRLMQIASNPNILFPDNTHTPGKFEAIDDLLRDILSVPSRKVIIWSNYVRTIQMLLERYSTYGSVALHGEVPVDERQEIAKKFQEDDSARVLIANPAAAGTGFTLTAASFAIYETLSWRYDFYAQSQDRSHRIGQEKPVTYMRIIAADTIEEAIVVALARKLDMASELLNDPINSASVRGLSREQMCELLSSNKLPQPH